MSVNKVMLLGNLGQDPEVRYTQGGTTIANLRIATSERRPDGQGGWKNETEWHTVVVFGKRADVIKQYMRKGSTIFIEGSLRTRKWQDKQGQTRYSTEVVANDFSFVGSANRQQGGGGGGYAGGDYGQQNDMGASVPPADDSYDYSGPPANDADIPF